MSRFIIADPSVGAGWGHIFQEPNFAKGDGGTVTKERICRFVYDTAQQKLVHLDGSAAPRRRPGVETPPCLPRSPPTKALMAPDPECRIMQHNFNDPILAGMARAMFVSTWADAEEEQGRTYPGQDLMDAAPETPKEVFLAAANLIGSIEARNSCSIYTLWDRACKADAAGPQGQAIAAAHPEISERTTAFFVDQEFQRLFGHYLAMEAMGHGVAWTDDHAPFEITMPQAFEFTYLDLPTEFQPPEPVLVFEEGPSNP